MMKTILITALMTLGLFSCAHSKPKVEPKANISVATIPAVPAGGETLVAPTPHASTTVPATMNEYLNSLVLPTLVNSNVVKECFLDNPKSKKKELAPGNLSYQFEIKLVTEGEQVVINHVYLSATVHLPLWVQPCIVKAYKKFVFQPFPDASVKSSTAFGTVNMNWSP